MSYQKLTPVIAKGATEPRYLEDRFADVVNVKDFGAKGDGDTDDTQYIQDAIDYCSDAGGGIVFIPSGTYMQTETLILQAGVILTGEGFGITVIKKEAGMNLDALHTKNYGETSGFPTNIGIRNITFNGNYLTTESPYTGNNGEDAYVVNSSGGGLCIDASETILDVEVRNNAGVGVIMKNTAGSAGKAPTKNSLYIYTSKYENLIYQGPADRLFDCIFAGDAGVVINPTTHRIDTTNITSSPTYGLTNGGLCDNVVIDNGVEINFIHAWGSYNGAGIRHLKGRLNVDLMISESNAFGNFVSTGTGYGMISKLHCHGGGGGGDKGASLVSNGSRFPDIYVNNTISNARGFVFGEIYGYSRSNVDRGQDKVVLRSAYNTISSLYWSGNGCGGNGLVLQFDNNAVANVHIVGLSGTDVDGNDSAGVVRECNSHNFNQNIVRGIVSYCPVVFRAVGTYQPLTEDINLNFVLHEGGVAFDGNEKAFGTAQNWDIRGTIDGVFKGTSCKGRVQFNPGISTEQTLTFTHNLIYAPNPSDVMLSIQDTGTSMSTHSIAYFYVSSVSSENITINLRMNDTSSTANTTTYVTVFAHI